MGAPGGDAEALKKKTDLWFILSIVSIFCGCGLLGIINIFFAHQAKQAYAAGDYATAEKKVGIAKILCIVGYVMFGLAVILNIISVVLNA